jgi:hypothetical protein
MLNATETPDVTTAKFDELPVTGRVFEPPTTPTLTAIARHKPLVVVCAVVLALVGVGRGLRRTPIFTASATLQVGQVNPNSPGFYGYTQSAASLATAFSRSIAAEPVLAAIQHKLKLTPAKALARLSSEPLPQSPAFRVIATGSNEFKAVQLANAAAAAVIAYEGQSNNTNPEARSLLHEYREAALRLQHSTEKLDDLTRPNHGKRAPSSVVARAVAERNAAGIELRAMGVAYTSAVTSQAPSSGLVSLVAGATSAGSDRSSKLELYAFIGLLLGLVIGCAIAVAWDRVRSRRLVAGT